MNLQLAGKISLEFDFSSSLLLKYDPRFQSSVTLERKIFEILFSPSQLNDVITRVLKIS